MFDILLPRKLPNFLISSSKLKTNIMHMGAKTLIITMSVEFEKIKLVDFPSLSKFCE